MLAARDQENLVHGHQTVAASKPLNQGPRQLAPKTPSNKVPKTPFKLPLNDENGNGGLGAGRTGLNVNKTGKNAFITPMGPTSRAPLGAKTTNAKAKALLTPASLEDDEKGKMNKKIVSARKPKAKVAETTRLEVHEDKDEAEVPEIEYMPPRPIPLPDLPDDHEPLNFSMFTQGHLFEGASEYFANRKGSDGLSFNERYQRTEERKQAIQDKKDEAALLRDLDSMPVSCVHYPECPGESCKDTLKARKEAEEEYEKTMAIIEAETAPKRAIIPQPVKSTGPSTIKSKAAVAALSQPKPSKPVKDPVKKSTSIPAKPRFGIGAITQPKKALFPTNIPPTRHTASIAASRTTLGRAKGRAVSSGLRKANEPSEKPNSFVPFEKRDTSIAPILYFSRYGEPPKGSEMWFSCWDLGLFGNERRSRGTEWEVPDEGKTLDKLIREDALDDFQLTLSG